MQLVVAPLEHETLGDRVYRQIAAMLVSERPAPGEKLSLRSTAEALGVSMMPVRAAVTRLVADQALEVAPNRAVRVPVTDAARFRDLTRIRVMIESYAAGQAASMRTADDLVVIAEAEAAFRREAERRKPDHAAAVAHNQRLHFAVYAAAGSPTLTDIIHALWLKAGPVINLDLRANPERLRLSRARFHHAELLQALRDGDAATASAALAADIQGAADYILSQGSLIDKDA